MNKIYRTIWNVARQCVMVVNEKTCTGHQSAGGAASSPDTVETHHAFSGRLTALAVGVMTALSSPVWAVDLNGYTNNGEIFTIHVGETYYASVTSGPDYGYQQWTTPDGKEPLLENYGTIKVGTKGVRARGGKVVNYGLWESQKHATLFGADAPSTDFAHFENCADATFHANGADSYGLETMTASARGQVFKNDGKVFANGGYKNGVGLEILDLIDSRTGNILIEGKLHNTSTGRLEAKGGGSSAYGLYVHDGAELVNDGEMVVTGGGTTDSYGLKMTDDTVWTNNGTVTATRTFKDSSGVISAGKFVNNGRFELINNADKNDLANPTASFTDMVIAGTGQVDVNNAVLKVTGTEGLVSDGILNLNAGSMLSASVLHNKGTLTFADDVQIRVGKFINEVDGFSITQFNGLNEQQEFAGFTVDNRAHNVTVDQAALATLYNSGSIVIKDLYGGNVYNTGTVTYDGPASYTVMSIPDRLIAWNLDMTNAGHIRWHSKVPYLSVTQTDPNAVLETYLSGLFDYSTQSPRPWDESRPYFRMSDMGWDFQGRAMVVSLVDFATGNGYDGIPLQPIAPNHYSGSPSVKIEAGTLVILDDFTPEAQGYIERMLRSRFDIPAGVKIEFPNTGNKDRFVHNVVFNVANTGAFVSGGGEGAVVPFPVRSEKGTVVIGGANTDIPGSVGLAALTGTQTITIQDGKTLLFKPWNGVSRLFDGTISVDNGTLKLGLETNDGKYGSGIGDDVRLGEMGQLIVAQPESLFTLNSLGGSGELKLLAGTLEIKSLDHMALGDLNMNAKSGLKVESGSGALSSATVNGGSLDLNMTVTDGNVGPIVNNGGTATLALNGVTQLNTPITNNGGTTSVSLSGAQVTVATETAHISNQNGTLNVAGDLVFKGPVRGAVTVRNESTMNTTGNWSLTAGLHSCYQCDFMLVNGKTAQYAHTGNLTLALDETAGGRTGAIHNQGAMTVNGRLSVDGARAKGVLLNAEKASLTLSGVAQVKAGPNQNGAAVLNGGTITIRSDFSATGGGQQNAIAVKNDREMNFAAEETGRITFQATGGDAAGTHGIHNSGSITNDSVVALNVNIAAGSVAGAYGLMNEGRVTLKKGFEFRFQGGKARDAVAVYNAKGATMTMAPSLFNRKSLVFDAGSADGAHALVNHGSIEVGGYYANNPQDVPDVESQATGSLTARASGIVNHGMYAIKGGFNGVNVLVPSYLTATGGMDGSYGFRNEAKGTLLINNGKLFLKGGQGTDAYGLYNEGTVEISNGTLSLQSKDGFLQAYGGQGKLKLVNTKVESDLNSIFRYAGADSSKLHAVFNQNGEAFEVDASAFATGEVIKGGITEVASFLANQGSLTIDIKDTGWSQSAVDKFQAALNGIAGSTITLNMKADGTKDLEDTRALAFTLANVNRYLQSNPSAGAGQGLIFGYDGLSSEKTSVKIGGSNADFDGWVGFRSEKGATDIELDGNQRFTLLGDGTHVSDAAFNVKNGSLYLGVDGIKAVQGGRIGALTIGPQGQLEVAAVDGLYEAPSLTIQNGRVNNRGQLRLDGSLDIRGGEIHNAGSIVAQSFTHDENAVIENLGTMSVGATALTANMRNEGTVKVGGALEIGASSVLTNAGTVLAQSLNCVGGYRFTQGARLSVGDAAVNEFLMTHPEVAKSLLDAGDTLSPEVVAAVYGMTPYALFAKESVARSTATQADGRYLTFDEAAPAEAAVLVATKKGGLKLDTSKTDNFGSRFSLNGDITGDHVVSADAQNGGNRTVDVRSQTVTNKATLTLLDASYLGANEALLIGRDSTLKIKDFESKALGYRPGALVVQGGVNNSGTMNSADASAVVVTGKGRILNRGLDEGYALLLEGQGRYTLDGGKSRYEDVRLDGGAMDIRNGTFAVGTNAPADKAKAVLALGSRLYNAGGVITVGTTAQKAVPGGAEVRFGADGALMVNITDAQTKPLLTGTGTLVAEEGSRFIVGESTWGRHQITSGLQTDAGILDVWSGEGFVNLSTNDAKLSLNTDGLVLAVGRKDAGNGQVDTSIQALSDRFALPGVINRLINDEAMSAKRDVNSDCADIAFVERMLNGGYVGKLKDGSLDVARASSLWNSATQLSAASGLSAYALDVARTTDAQVTSHLNEGVDASGFWVQVEGRQGGADRLESSGAMTGGYRSDVYGMTFGADVLATDAWTLGAALHYEDGDLESRGDYTDTRTDVEAFGVSAYAKRKSGNLSVTTQLGFSHVTGDVRQTFDDAKKEAYRIEGDLKANALTAGVRVDVSHPITPSLDLIPHAGLSYTHAQFDGYGIRINGKNAFTTEKHDVDLVEVPLGVTMKGTFAAGEWAVQPFADLTVRPALGDTDANARVNAVSYGGTDAYRYDVAGRFAADVVLGLEAAKGAHAVGVSYRGSAGSQGTESHALSMSYRMTF